MMAIFRYEVADATGKMMRGAMEATSAQEVQTRLGGRYSYVNVLPPEGAAFKSATAVPASLANKVPTGTGSVSGPKVKPAQLGIFFRQLVSLTHAGFTIGAALADLAPRTSNQGLARAVQAMAQAVTAGNSLAGEMSRWPTLFAPHMVGVIAAGETGGFLEFALEEAALGAEQDAALGQGLWWSKFLIWQSVWSVILLQPAVNNLDMLTGKSVDVGGYGRNVLIWWVVLGILAHGGWFLFQWFWKLPSSVGWRDRLSLRIPVLARLAKMRGLAAFTRVLRRLLQSGILTESAYIGAARAVPNTVLSTRLLGGAAIVRGGQGIDAAIQSTGMMDNDPLQLLVTGQKTGQWLEMLDQVTAYYQEEAMRAMEAVKSAQRRAGILLTIISSGYVTIVLTHSLYNAQFRWVDQNFGNE